MSKKGGSSKHRPSGVRRGLQKTLSSKGDGFTQENFFEPFDKLRFGESPNVNKAEPAFQPASPDSPAVFRAADIPPETPETPVLVPGERNPFAFSAWSKILSEAEDGVATPPASSATEKDIPKTNEAMSEDVALELAKLPALQMEQERLLHDLQMLKSDNAWYKSQLATAQQNVTNAKSESVLAQRTLIAERETNRLKKHVSSNENNLALISKLQQELKVSKQRNQDLANLLAEEKSIPRNDEFQNRINVLESELRESRKEAAEWRAEKTILERDSNLVRLENSFRKNNI